jgi:hypothetical protein
MVRLGRARRGVVALRRPHREGRQVHCAGELTSATARVRVALAVRPLAAAKGGGALAMVALTVSAKEGVAEKAMVGAPALCVRVPVAASMAK